SVGLVKAARDKDANVRQQALWALQSCPVNAKTMLAPIVKLIQKEQGYPRQTAISVLGRLGEKAVPPLLNLLKDKDAGTRSTAAAALGNVGEAAKEAIEPLTGLARKDDNPQVRSAAVYALGGIGP